eukprot:5706349-Pyramimonas_sp.AAC.1
MVGTRPCPDSGALVGRRHAGDLRAHLPPLRAAAAAALHPAEGERFLARTAGQGRRPPGRCLGRAVGRAVSGALCGR